jgi:hypothetical protein
MLIVIDEPTIMKQHMHRHAHVALYQATATDSFLRKHTYALTWGVRGGITVRKSRGDKRFEPVGLFHIILQAVSVRTHP